MARSPSLWVARNGLWKSVGLSKEMLSQGRQMTVHGHRSVEEDVRRVRAERVVIDGKDYILYPDRNS